MTYKQLTPEQLDGVLDKGLTSRIFILSSYECGAFHTIKGTECRINIYGNAAIYDIHCVWDSVEYELCEYHMKFRGDLRSPRFEGGFSRDDFNGIFDKAFVTDTIYLFYDVGALPVWEIIAALEWGRVCNEFVNRESAKSFLRVEAKPEFLDKNVRSILPPKK